MGLAKSHVSRYHPASIIGQGWRYRALTPCLLYRVHHRPASYLKLIERDVVVFLGDKLTHTHTHTISKRLCSQEKTSKTRMHAVNARATGAAESAASGSVSEEAAAAGSSVNENLDKEAA